MKVICLGVPPNNHAPRLIAVEAPILEDRARYGVCRECAVERERSEVRAREVARRYKLDVLGYL